MAAGGRITTGLGVSLLSSAGADRNPDATVFVGNLDPAVTEPLLWELAGQAGPVHSVYMPLDRVTGAHQGYAFVEFKADADADYAIKVLNMVRLHGKPLRVNKSAQDKATADVGGVLLPKEGLTDTGSIQFMLVPEVWRKKSCPQASKVTPHGFGMDSCAVRSR